MAEFLVKAVDAMHEDPVKDARGCYKRGDIVDVRPDGFAWGREEDPATANPRRFVLVKITGLDAEKAKAALAQPQRSDFVFEPLPEEADPLTRVGVVTRRRRFHVLWDTLPLAARNALKNTGVLTVTWAAVRDFLHDQRDNATFAGKVL